MINNDGVASLKFIKDNNLSFSYIRSEDNCIDITSSNCSKWHSLESILTILDINPLEVVSVGNHINDIEMIKKSGVGIAVASAIDELKS